MAVGTRTGAVHLAHRRGQGATGIDGHVCVRYEFLDSAHRLDSARRWYDAPVVCACVCTDAVPDGLGALRAVDAAVGVGAWSDHPGIALCPHVGRCRCRTIPVALVGLSLGLRGAASGGFLPRAPRPVRRNDTDHCGRHRARSSRSPRIRGSRCVCDSRALVLASSTRRHRRGCIRRTPRSDTAEPSRERNAPYRCHPR